MEYTEINELEKIIAQSRCNQIFKTKPVYSPRSNHSQQEFEIEDIEDMIEASSPI